MKLQAQGRARTGRHRARQCLRLRDGPIAVGIGYTANHALTAAIRHEPCDPERVDLDVRDEAVAPENHDSAYLASAAVARGPALARGSERGSAPEVQMAV